MSLNWKMKILQQLSSAFQDDRGRHTAYTDSRFGAQVAEEFRLIKNSILKTTVKRRIMNDI